MNNFGKDLYSAKQKKLKALAELRQHKFDPSHIDFNDEKVKYILSK